MSAPDRESEPMSVRLDRLMKRLNVQNRTQLAEMLGYSRTQLYSIERGDVVPSRKFMISLEALEREADGAENVVRDDGPLASLISAVELDTLCDLLIAAVNQIKSTGRPTQVAIEQAQRLLDEIKRRQTARVTYRGRAKDSL